MNLVTTLKQIERNITELERGRSAGGDGQGEYLALIKRGTCFLPYESSLGLAFAPSRFVGYINNKIESHADNPNRDGRKTNAALNELLGIRPRMHKVLEQAYLDFCVKIGVTSSKTGTFGVERKYWITAEISQLLDNLAENNIYSNPNLSKLERQQLVKARIGQGEFRENLVTMWGKCCVTGCTYIVVLRASHIKPWRDSTDYEKLDKFNGLLLSPNLDALFDKGLISFRNSGEILVSSVLSDSSVKVLGCPKDAKLSLQPEHAKYLTWHRENIFIE
jgi:putative restriction endonuclease